MRYQFAGSGGRTAGGWDANWLIIAGTVQTAEGRSWSFEDPCLTTSEARSLGSWLAQVGSGALEPTPSGDAGSEDGLLTFTEPNLAFSLAGRQQTAATVRVHLSLEASPPWLSRSQIEIFAFYVQIHAALTEFTRAAGGWQQELVPFPQI